MPMGQRARAGSVLARKMAARDDKERSKERLAGATCVTKQDEFNTGTRQKEARMAVLTKGTWVLIADGEKALFLRNDLNAKNPDLSVIRKDEQHNPPDSVQSASRPGRKPDAGINQFSAMEETDWHELAKERFASDLAERLYKYAHRGAFDRIVLVAAPNVLGALRKELHKEVQDRVVAEIDKDLTNHPLDKVEAMLKAMLDPAL